MENRGYYQGIANRTRIDMDSRSPRLRLSIIGFLAEAGVTPKKMRGPEEWLNLVKSIVNYVGEEHEAFAEGVEKLVVPEEGTNDEPANAYDIMKAGDGGYR